MAWDSKKKQTNMRLTVRYTYSEEDGLIKTAYAYDVGPEELKRMAKVYISVSITEFGRYAGWAKGSQDHMAILEMVKKGKVKQE